MRRRKVIPNPPLQPLRIPSGWTVDFNDFYEVEPTFKTYDDSAWNFKEDMLQIKHERFRLLVDLGWYPTARSTGGFGLRLLHFLGEDKGADWENPIEFVQTRSKRKVVKVIEDWLHHDWSSRAKPKKR